ncbi:MAG: hypothetical protein HY606_11675 [Planctomycetes bacterium]|nr:hypothetical protein [Planctomycetota bacterium]
MLTLYLLLQAQVLVSEGFEQVPDVRGDYPGWEQITSDEFPFYNSGSVHFEGRNGSGQSFKLTSLGGKVKFLTKVQFNKSGYITVNAFSRHIKGAADNQTFIELTFFSNNKIVSSLSSSVVGISDWIHHEIYTTTPSGFDEISVAIVFYAKNKAQSSAIFDDVLVEYHPKLEVTTPAGDYMIFEHPNPLKLSIPSFDSSKKYKLNIKHVLTGETKEMMISSQDSSVNLDLGYYRLKLEEQSSSPKLYLSEVAVYKSVVSKGSRFGISIDPLKDRYASFTQFIRFNPSVFKITVVDDKIIDALTLNTLKSELNKTEFLYAFSNPVLNWEETFRNREIKTLLSSIKAIEIVIADEFSRELPKSTAIQIYIKDFRKGFHLIAPSQLDIQQDSVISEDLGTNSDYYITKTGVPFQTYMFERLKNIVNQLYVKKDKKCLMSMMSAEPIQEQNGYLFPAWQFLLYNTMNYLSSSLQITKFDRFMLPNAEAYVFKISGSNIIMIWNTKYDEFPIDLVNSQSITDVFLKPVNQVDKSGFPTLIHNIPDNRLALINSVRVNGRDDHVLDISLKRDAQLARIQFENVLGIKLDGTRFYLNGLPEGVRVTESSSRLEGNNIVVDFTLAVSETVPPQEKVISIRVDYGDRNDRYTAELPILMKITPVIDLQMEITKEGENDVVTIYVTNKLSDIQLNLSLKLTVENYRVQNEVVIVKPQQTEVLKMIFPDIGGSVVRLSAVDHDKGYFSNLIKKLNKS